MFTVQTYARAEVWDAPECDGGVRVGILTGLTVCQARGSVESDGQLALECPAGHADAALLASATRGIVRLVGTGEDEFDEWRLISDVVPLAGGVVRATACALALDLANGTLVGLTDGAGATGYDFDAVGLTPAQHLAAHIIPALVAVGVTWVAPGTIEPTAPIDVTYRSDSPWSAARKVAALAQSPTAATHECRLRRVGTTGYVLDIVARIGSAAPVADVRAAKNLVDGARETVGVDRQTRVVPLGSAEDGRRATMARAEWQVTGVAGGVVTLADPAGGAGPIAFDGQLAPYTVPGGTLVPGAYLRKPDGTLTAVTASSADAQTVTVADASGLAVDARVQFRADAAGADLTWLDHPAEAASAGVKIGTVEAGDTAGTRNVLPNPAARDWPVGDALPVGWTAVGVPAQILRGTAAPYTRIGGQSVRVVGDGDGTGVQLPAGPLAPSALARYASGYAQVWVVAGQVRVELVVTTPGGEVVFPMLPAVASSSILGQWLDLGASGLDAYAIGATSAALRVVQHGTTEATFYVDAAQVTETPTQYPFVEGSGGTRLWQMANVRLAEQATPQRTYACALVDLARVDGATWGADCAITLGGDLRLTSAANGATPAETVVVRVVGFELLDYLNPGATRLVIGAPQRTLAQRLGATGLRTPSGLASFVTSPTPLPGTPNAPGGNTTPAAGAVDTQPVIDAASGAFERRGWQWAEPFDAARLYVGEVVAAGAAGAELVGEFSADGGTEWQDFGAAGATVRAPLDAAGPVLGALVALRPECVGDVLWRVSPSEGSAELRNVALQWLRRNGAVPGRVPPPSIDPGGDPGGVLPEDPEDPEDPVCAFYNATHTSATFADMAAWEAAADPDTESRYAGDPAASAMTAEGYTILGDVLAADDFPADTFWHASGTVTKVVYRSRFKGEWLRRSSKWRLQLGRLRGTGFAHLEAVLWNHALNSHGVDQERIWFKHNMANPAFGGFDTTPGPLIADVLNAEDYELFFFAEDLGNPDGAGKHDVRYVAWGGPVGGPHTKWLDLTGKLTAIGFSDPLAWSFSFAEAPRPYAGSNSPYNVNAPAYGEGAAEKAGAAGDYLVVRGGLLAAADCVDEFPIPGTTAVPPAPLAQPDVTVLFEEALTFIPGSFVGIVGPPVEVGDGDDRGISCTGPACTVETGPWNATISVEVNDHSATARCSTSVTNDVGPDLQYTLEAELVDGEDMTFGLLGWTNIGGATYRRDSPLPVADPFGGAWVGFTFGVAPSLAGPPLVPAPCSVSIDNPVIKRYGPPEGYP